jgi:predicted esterase
MSALTIPAIGRHTATVIMAHGLGDSGAGWVSLAENWRRRSKFQEVKFIFPNAPSIPITVNGGFVMPGWYDIVKPPGTQRVRLHSNINTVEAELTCS